MLHVRRTRNTRRALAVAVLASAALTLTACQPDDTGATGGTDTPSASASDPAKGGGKGACPTIAKGHKVVRVESVSGAMNTITAQDTTCNPGSGQGASYAPVKGKEGEYTVVSEDTEVTILSKKSGKPKTFTARNGGVQHVRVCANGTEQDTATTPADTSDCWGPNLYDIAVGPGGKITKMTEVKAS